MSRYIDADAFIAEKREQYCKECDRRKGKRNGKQTILYEIGEAPCRACGIDDMIDDIEDAPTADVAPVVHGHWETIYNDCGHYGFVKCTACGDEYGSLTNRYCPNCGAKMDAEEEPKK